MQNENKQHWKEKLSDAKALSAETGMNKEVSWEALNQRLQQRSKRRKALLYWLSAACLLPVFAMLSLPFFQNKNSTIKPVVHQSFTTKTSVPETGFTQNQVVVAKQPVIAAKKKTTPGQSDASIAGIDTRSEPVIAGKKDSALQPVIIASLLPADSIVIQPAFAVQQKKKLPVVHINELNEPVESTPIMAHTIDRHFSPLQIARGEVYGNEVKVVRNVSFISFKTKSPSN